ncbi:MAG: hypothetical protein VB054_01335 [Petrimonas sp.]|nr:hypothetical protein [Petrimonas sp.]
MRVISSSELRNNMKKYLDLAMEYPTHHLRTNNAKIRSKETYLIE